MRLGKLIRVEVSQSSADEVRHVRLGNETAQQFAERLHELFGTETAD